jgi:tRNA U38,U39,U40 pseudouridine synthase TruA
MDGASGESFVCDEDRSNQKQMMMTCAHCDEKFTSKNKLFDHLSSHGVERDSVRSIRPGKVVLLVGWLSHVENDDEDQWEMDGHLSHAWTSHIDRVERELFHAIDEIDGGVITDGTTSSSRGLSRASNCAQRASHLLQIEKTSHCVTDVFCFQIPGKSKPKDSEWLASVNSKLSSDIRVIEVYNLPTSMTEFHAEAACSQRVYEYVLPLHILFPPDNYNNHNNGHDTTDTSSDDNNESIKLEYRKVKEKVWCKMDVAFPKDTPEAMKRIEKFRRLKILLKLFCGKNSYHNYITGGASPEDGHVKKRVDRFYHKEMLSIHIRKKSLDTSTIRALLQEGQAEEEEEAWISDVCHDPFHDIHEPSPDTSTDTSASTGITEDWAVLSLSGNTFLKGQPRRMIGLAIAVMWGWLPISLIEASLNSQNILHLPQVPGCGLYLSECRYDKWEAKSIIRFDPRRIESAATSESMRSMNQWIRMVQTFAMKAMRRRGYDWMRDMKTDCEKCFLCYEIERSLRLRSVEQLIGRIESGDCVGIPTTLPVEIYQAYETVLRLLREADQSGQWPLSSQVRLPPSFAPLSSSPLVSVCLSVRLW